MANYKNLKARLDRGETIIHDAADSTELQSMGVPMDFVAWSGPSNYTHPSSVIQMHERHIRAGSDIITTNTWSTLRPTLEGAGYGDFVREINARLFTWLKKPEIGPLKVGTYILLVPYQAT